MSTEDPLQREIDEALQDVRLQDLGPDGEPAPERGRGKRPDGLVPGTVVGVNQDDVIVELGPRMQGVCSLREFDEPPQPGARHHFKLAGREDDLWLLSLREAREIAAWSDLAVGSLVKARVSGQNTGGLELKIGSHAAFMPASQVALGRDEDLSRHIGETMTCEVLEIDRSRDRVVLSRRKVLERERDEARRASAGRLEVGARVSGKVTRVEAYGAFVDIGGGLEGLLHVKNLSHQRVEDVSQVLSVGQPIEVAVLSIEEGGRRVGLGRKQLEPDPWDGLALRLGEDSLHVGRVTRVTDFGAFVELAPGVEGLLHVSQLGPERVRKVSERVKVGDEVSVRVLSIDPSARRLSLSRLDARGALLGSDEAVEAEVIDEVLERSSRQTSLGTNLGDLFKKALDRREGR